MTGEDFPGHIGLYLQDRYIFCRDRVRYVGDPVAGVAAISEEIAEKAVDLIEVEYEVLRAGARSGIWRQPRSAPAPSRSGQVRSRQLHLPPAGHQHLQSLQDPQGRCRRRLGAVRAIVERKYRIPHIQHVPIEPHVAVAQVDETGKITLWGSSQSPFAQRNLIAKALGISQSDVQVIAPYVGGGFGCKAGVSMEALAVAIAIESARDTR